MEHLPTGVTRNLYIAERGKRKEFLSREQALQEIVFEVAENFRKFQE